MRRILKHAVSGGVAICLLAILGQAASAQVLRSTEREDTSRLQLDEQTSRPASSSYPTSSYDLNRRMALSQMYSGLELIEAKPPNYDKAEKAFLKAIELDPNLITDLSGLGFIYTAQGRYLDAERVYRQNLGLAPQSIDPHYNLAIVYQKQGRTVEAQKELEIVSDQNKKLGKQLERELGGSGKP